MSILEYPRIYFRGEISWDPVTTNNNTLPTWIATYDEGGADPQLNGATVGGKDVQAFRDAAIAQIPAQNWNPAGTYRSIFYDCRVSGVDTGAGLNTTDAFVGAPANFAGMLIDAEPYGPFSSQLFFDAIQFGIDGGCRILGKPVRRSSDRYINFRANPANAMIAGVASVMWQACYEWQHLSGLASQQDMETEAPVIIDAYDSPALGALRSAMDQPGVKGLMTRFVTYRTIYYDDLGLGADPSGVDVPAKALMAKFATGGFQPNPARSLLVGTVGLWRDGDPIHEPGDRTLVTTGTPVALSADAKPLHAPFGTAWARANEGSVAFDLSNSIPWQTLAPAKADVGDITLSAGDMVLGVLTPDRYDQAAYLATSGIVDMPLSTAQIPLDPGDLTLSVEIAGKPVVLLAEQALRAIPLEPNFYVDQGTKAQAQVRVYDRGMPAGAGIEVQATEMGALENNPLIAVTDETGVASFPLKTAIPTVTGLVFQPGPVPIQPVPASGVNPQVSTYMYLRVLPLDDHLAKLTPNWANVYDHVLSFWHAMAPCMDNWLRLDDEKQVRAYGPLIKKLTDPGYFERYRYMPVSRDLTAGQRTLLYNFLDGAPQPAVLTASEEAEVPKTDFAKLARAMR